MTPWTYIGRKALSPISAMAESSVAPLAEAMERRPQSASATIGSGARRSWATNSTPPTAKTARAIRTLRSEVPISVSAAISAAMAMVNSVAPATSTWWVVSATFSRRKSMNRVAAISPTGTLIQKIHAQVRCWTMRPPASGPTTDEMPQTLER